MIEQLLSIFVSEAHADTVAGAAQQAPQGGVSFVMMFAIFFLFIYFAIWRPQSKRAKEQRNLLDSLAKGDEVVTAGGLVGRLTKITDAYISLSVANNMDIIMQKSAIVSVLPKGTLKSIE